MNAMILMGEFECIRHWNKSSLMASMFQVNGPFTEIWKKLASVIGQRESQMESEDVSYIVTEARSTLVELSRKV